MECMDIDETGLFLDPHRARGVIERLHVSSTASTDGDAVAMMTVLHRPPSDSCSRRVNFESRYGMRPPVVLLPSRRAVITRPSVSSDWLMFLRSRSRVSEPLPAVFAHSEPARSTMCNFLVLHYHAVNVLLGANREREEAMRSRRVLVHLRLAHCPPLLRRA